MSDRVINFDSKIGSRNSKSLHPKTCFKASGQGKFKGKLIGYGLNGTGEFGIRSIPLPPKRKASHNLLSRSSSEQVPAAHSLPSAITVSCEAFVSAIVLRVT